MVVAQGSAKQDFYKDAVIFRKSPIFLYVLKPVSTTVTVFIILRILAWQVL